jgi:metal-responsive CopG/Arc/MetJ family transcriptional regulator
MIHRRRAALPPKLADETQRINLIADRKWLDKIDEWRKRQGWPAPTRSDAIRRLVDQALDAPKGDKPKKPKK